MQTPNSDTPYSWVGFDLRAEPVVVTVPRIEKGRYWSLQFGTREYLKNNYLYRMAAAVLGIYGNSKQTSASASAPAL